MLYYDALPRCYFINVSANLAFSQVPEKAMFLSFDREKGKERKRVAPTVGTPTAASAVAVVAKEEEKEEEEEEILSLNRGKKEVEEGRRRRRKKRKIINGSFYENHKFLTRPIKYPRFS